MKTPYYNVPNLQKIADLQAEIERLRQGKTILSDLLYKEEARANRNEAEIERLRERLEQSYAKQTYKEWERNLKLITKLADELDRFHRYSENMDLDILIDYSLVKQAREATKDE